jgi:hypothetical protein
VLNYFKPCRLTFPYTKLEHKPEHISKIVGFIRKSDNGMMAVDDNGYFNKPIFKLRGEKHINIDRIPPKELLLQVLKGSDNPKLLDCHYTEEKINTPKDFRRAHSRKEVENNVIKLIPGLSRVVDRTYVLNNTHHSIDTIAQYKLRNSKKHESKKDEWTKLAQISGYRESNLSMEADSKVAKVIRNKKDK